MNAENVQEYLFNNSAPCDTNFRGRFPVIQARCAKCGVMRVWQVNIDRLLEMIAQTLGMARDVAVNGFPL